jgi:hypothetical protein
MSADYNDRFPGVFFSLPRLAVGFVVARVIANTA